MSAGPVEFEADSSHHTIEYPATPSEFEVHAYLYSALRARGVDARGEVKARGCFGMRKAKTSCRFDIVIFDADKKATQILEIKGGVVMHKSGGFRGTRQGRNYTHFGVPVVLIYGMPAAIAYLDKMPAVVGEAFG